MHHFRSEVTVRTDADMPVGRVWRLARYFGMMAVKTATVSVLAGVSAYLSYKRHLRIDLNGNNIATVAVIYPLVFAVNAAYQRRQEALLRLASLKGHAFALRLCFAHWAREERKPAEILAAGDVILEKFFEDLKSYLSRRKLSPELEDEIIGAFAALSLLVEKLRAEGVTPTEMTRANEYIRSMLVDFEVMKTFHVYRTPSSLLWYTKFFLLLIPIVYGPVFADIAFESGAVEYGVFLAVLLAVVLIALDNTQDVLENPYDGLCKDDIQFKKPAAILRSRVHRSWSEAVPHIRLHEEGGGRASAERLLDKSTAAEATVHSPLRLSLRPPSPASQR
jgi:hypothetical protein